MRAVHVALLHAALPVARCRGSSIVRTFEMPALTGASSTTFLTGADDFLALAIVLRATPGASVGKAAIDYV